MIDARLKAMSAMYANNFICIPPKGWQVSKGYRIGYSLTYRNSHKAIRKEKLLLEVQDHATVKVSAGTNSCYSRDNSLAGTVDVAATIFRVSTIKPFLVEAVNIYWTIELASPDKVGGPKMGVRDDDGFETTLRVDLKHVCQ